MEMSKELLLCHEDLLEEAVVAAAQEGNSELCKELLDHGSHLPDEVAGVNSIGLIPLVRKLQPLLRKGATCTINC